MKKDMTNDSFASPYAQAAYSTVRSLHRSHDLNHLPVNWTDQGWFWFAFQSVWSTLSGVLREPVTSWNGPAATADDLTAALVGRGVPRTAIRPFGAHTLVTLDNVSFVYRAKQYKPEGSRLLVAPHITGRPFSGCGHSFVHPFGTLDDLAETMVRMDRAVPQIRQACLTALGDARKESAERAIKTRTAETLLSDIFDGAVPENVRWHVDGARHPEDLDVVRLEIRHGGGTVPPVRWVDVPLDLPRECIPSIAEMCLEPWGDVTRAYIELFIDEDTGEYVPVQFNYGPFGDED